MTTSPLSHWLSSGNQQTTSAGKDVGKREPQCTVGGNAGWRSHCGQQYGVSSKKLKMELSFDPLIQLLGIYPKNPEPPIWKNIRIPNITAALFITAKIWEQPKCPPVDEWIKRLWYNYTMECYMTEKKKELLPFVAEGMDMETIMLSE